MFDATNLMHQVGFFRPSNAVAAGTTAVNGAAVDMTDYDGILFIAALGALTATQVTSLKAQQGAQSDGSDAVDITGAATDAAADTDSNKFLVLDVGKNLINKRYVRPVLNRGTANAVLDGIIAIPYKARKVPTSLSATFVSKSKAIA